MRAFEKLLSLSSLNICATAANHFCSIEKGSGEQIINVIGLYDVEYLGEEILSLEYKPTAVYGLEYLGEEVFTIEYKKNETYNIEYLGEEIIDIKYRCNKE